MKPNPVTPLFTGRETELHRLEAALARVRVAWIYGVGGVGKTSLACAFAQGQSGPVVFCDAGTAPLDALIDDARRELGPRARPEPREFTAKLQDLVRRLDTARATWIIDDAHELGDADCATLVETLALRLEGGRAILTSRHRLIAGARAPDRLELHLEGLEPGAANRLWSALDELYGSASGFDAALAKSRGNPLLLRRAHAGPLDDEDLLGSELGRLDADARELALALSIAGRPLPAAALEALLPQGRVRPALRALVTALIAEVDATGTARIHDLFREALLSRTGAAEQREARAKLVLALPEAGFDVATLLRELSRHLGALERFEELDAALLEREPEAVRSGATGELLRCMDLIPPERRSMALRIERARAVGRHYEMQRAYDELKSLYRETDNPPPELAYAHAEAAYDQCRPAETLEALSSILDQEGAGGELRARAMVRAAAALTVLGRGDEGRALLQKAADASADPVFRARMALQEAMSFNAEERWEQAAGALGRARALLSDSTLDEHAIFVPLTFAVIYSRAGRMQESDALLAKLDLTALPEDDSARIFILASHASLLFDRGERLRSLELRLESQRLNEPLGGVHYSMTAALWLSRSLFTLGRRREADALLGPALARAKELGITALAARLETARLADPRAALDAELPTPPASKTSDFVRARVLAALSAAALGDEPAAEVALEQAAPSLGNPGYALDRAIAHLARGLIARRRGRDGEARRELESARRAAAAENVDAEVLLSLEQWARKRAGVTSEPPPIEVRPRIVLDTRSHELRHETERISLKTRPVLRRLLYALASRPNTVVSKDDLVQRMWSVGYDPLRHDTPLWQNIRRLRQLVAEVGLRVEVDESGYRLLVPDGFVVDGAL